MATVQEVFDCAMALMDEVDPATGSTDTADTAEYKARTLPIVNALAIECGYLSGELRDEGRYITPLTSFADPIELSGRIVTATLPYGLAAHLLLDENPAAANFFHQRYEELQSVLKKGTAAVPEPILDVYGPQADRSGGAIKVG